MVNVKTTERRVDQKELVKRVQENRQSIDSLHIKIDKLTESIEPVLQIQEDVAAVGRLGGYVKKFVVWCTVVCGALWWLWDHIPKFKWN